MTLEVAEVRGRADIKGSAGIWWVGESKEVIDKRGYPCGRWLRLLGGTNCQMHGGRGNRDGKLELGVKVENGMIISR